ncbi:membrane-associated phosphatidylinositol transfer protein 3 isoform X2 [Takifugu rubripes]|uniref:Membrane-associated phosphatidylinositol transfer protein 3 n=1 Tax=Takifugu rubripes TaxID=31033 RepID=A0A674NFG4_TAKRU|nr:membrane-associated phosphatidylinositol transfer protein 3 isoform X2 [Takifugu rubripes]
MSKEPRGRGHWCSFAPISSADFDLCVIFKAPGSLESSELKEWPQSSSQKHSAAHWCLQNIAQESIDSSDEEFFDARDVMEGKNAILLGMSQWNSNDLVEQIETLGHMEDQSHAEGLYQLGVPRCPPQSSIEGLEDIERKCKTHVLLLVVHGGHILDTAGGDPSTKSGDVATLTSVLEKVTRAHFKAASEHVMIKLVPCPAVCAEAFSLVSNLNPYSYDESCVSSSVDHLPLAALPLLAIVSPRYQDTVATVIARANQVYHSFLQSEEGQGFTGQVCLMGDCVGGVLCFDALCFSNHQRPTSPNNSSRNNSTESLKDSSGLHGESSPGLSSSKRLSKSNIDISAPNEGHSQNRPPLSRKQSDSYDGDSSSAGQRCFFSSLMKDSVEARGCSTSLVVNPGHFDFDVTYCFLLGCPLGLVLAMRRTVLPAVQVNQLHPACSQIFNLFYPSDPSASRLEPLLQPLFHKMPPFAISRYQRYPLGEGRSTLIAEAIQDHKHIFLECRQSPGGPAFQPPAETTTEGGGEEGGRRGSATSLGSVTSICSMGQLGDAIANISRSWWGSKRLDYALYCPDVLTAFPTVALPHLFHASYWESTDVAAFVLRQLMRCDCVKTQEADNLDSAPFSPSSPREKWLRRRTHVKLRNVTANHRVNDAIATEDGPQTLVGRFMYGPLDMVTLTGEKVDIFLMTQPQSGHWVHFDTEMTNSSGRVAYTIPKSKKLGLGVYPIKMVVKGDQTSAEAYLTVLPRAMECVVFSIDGSFAASVSIMGSDPKVRPGAVDVVRHWQDLGYLIIYITGRPDMQKQRVVSWLSQHNFPHGMIFFSEGLVHDPLRQKTIFLRNLIQECHIKIISAYGSMKDISVYNMLGLSPSQIYIVGRPSKKYQNQCQFLSDGYAAHLSTLQFGHRARPKKSPSVRMVLRKGSFGLSAKSDFLCKRTHLRRTMSVQQPDPPCTPNPKPERAQSQPESDKDHGGQGTRSGGGAGGGGQVTWGRASMLRGDTTP